MSQYARLKNSHHFPKHKFLNRFPVRAWSVGTHLAGNFRVLHVYVPTFYLFVSMGPITLSIICEKPVNGRWKRISAVWSDVDLYMYTLKTWILFIHFINYFESLFRYFHNFPKENSPWLYHVDLKKKEIKISLTVNCFDLSLYDLKDNLF